MKLTPIRQPKNLIPNPQPGLRHALTQLDNRPRKLHAHGLGRLRRNRVLALALQQVHAVQSECLHFYQGMVAGRGGPRGSPVDVEGVRGAFFVFYRCVLLAFLMVLLGIGPETYRLLALFWGLTFGVVEVGSRMSAGTLES